jgi:hypothetical protein
MNRFYRKLRRIQRFKTAYQQHCGGRRVAMAVVELLWQSCWWTVCYCGGRVAMVVDELLWQRTSCYGSHASGRFAIVVDELPWWWMSCYSGR